MSLQDSPAVLCINMFIQTSLSSCQTQPKQGSLSGTFSHYKGEHSTSKRGQFPPIWLSVFTLPNMQLLCRSFFLRKELNSAEWLVGSQWSLEMKITWNVCYCWEISLWYSHSVLERNEAFLSKDWRTPNSFKELFGHPVHSSQCSQHETTTADQPEMSTLSTKKHASRAEINTPLLLGNHE